MVSAPSGGLLRYTRHRPDRKASGSFPSVAKPYRIVFFKPLVTGSVFILSSPIVRDSSKLSPKQISVPVELMFC